MSDISPEIRNLILQYDGDTRAILKDHPKLDYLYALSDMRENVLEWFDFDENGSVDPIFCLYIGDSSFPYVTRDELLDQISATRNRFTDYKSYADVTLEKIFTAEELKGAKKLSATDFKTTCFIMNANGKFEPSPLPVQAQYAPVFAINSLDVDKDGFPDLVLGGNINQARLRFGKYDASFGTLLKGNGKGGFTYVPQYKSGLSWSF